MGSISKAIASAAVTAGAHVVTNAEVCHQVSLLAFKFTPSIVDIDCHILSRFCF